MLNGSIRRALLALAVGGFAIGTGEFVMMGLLPQVASDLSVSIPQAGQLIAAYALGVVVGAPLLTAASVRYRRKTVLMVLMGWFAAGNILSAVAPGFGLVMAARFATGLPHGAFFGAGAVVAGSLVDKSRSNSAMAVMFAGLTVANIVGVPLTTILGQHAGWRLVYALVGVIAAIAVLAIAVFVPQDAAHRSGETEAAISGDVQAAVGGGAEAMGGGAEATDGEVAAQKAEKAGAGGQVTPPSLRGELRAFRNPEVWLVLGVAMLGGGGLFATFSYITPMMTHVAGYADASITWLLVLFGLGMTVGNLVGARLSDRFPARTLLLSLVLEIVVAVGFLAADHSKVGSAIAIFLFPMAALAGLPTLQGRVITLAGGAPNLAAASIQAAFNIANSLGAYLGGLAIAAGFGYSSPNVVAAGLVTIGLVLAACAVAVERRRRAGGDAAAEAAPETVREMDGEFDERERRVLEEFGAR